VPQRQIDGAHVLRKAADRSAVDPGFCDGAHGFQADAARGFEFGASSRNRASAALLIRALSLVILRP